VRLLVDQEIEQEAGSLAVATVPLDEPTPIDRAPGFQPERLLRQRGPRHVA
jgi:hypothetical protein